MRTRVVRGGEIDLLREHSPEPGLHQRVALLLGKMLDSSTLRPKLRDNRLQHVVAVLDARGSTLHGMGMHAEVVLGKRALGDRRPEACGIPARRSSCHRPSMSRGSPPRRPGRVEH